MPSMPLVQWLEVLEGVFGAVFLRSACRILSLDTRDESSSSICFHVSHTYKPSVKEVAFLELHFSLGAKVIVSSCSRKSVKVET